MAAISNATTATTVTHHINSEIIERAISYACQTPHTWQLFTYSPFVPNTSQYAHPIIAQIAAAAAHTETDEVSATEITRTQATITTAEYAVAAFLGDRAKRKSLVNEEAIAVNRLVDSIHQKIDDDVFALATSMTNTQGNNATVNTVVNFNSVISNFRVQIGSSSAMPIMVMSASAIRDLHEDSATNAAAIYGSLIGVQLHEATGGVNQGKRRSFGTIEFIESANVATSDTTGKGNFITLLGGATDTGLMVPIGWDLFFEVGRVAERIGSWLVASIEYGAGIVDNNRCREFITRA